MPPIARSAWYVTSPSLLRDAAALDAIRADAKVSAPVSAAERSAQLEDLVVSHPSALTLDGTGHATLHAPEGPLSAGRFETPTIAELRARLARRAPSSTSSPAPSSAPSSPSPPASASAPSSPSPPASASAPSSPSPPSSRSSPASPSLPPSPSSPRPRHRARLSVLEGADVLTDIGTMQSTAPDGVLFQAASQFNALESPEPCIVPVREYVFDPTQGPRASVSALPGTLVRHYAAPAGDGSRFVQTDARCLNLLADAVPPELADVRCGYLSSNDVRDMASLAGALTARWEAIRVGLHAEVEVVFGHAWNGRVARPGMRIAQVFTSTIALGGYGHDDGSEALATVRQRLQRGAYTGTLLGAAAVGAHTAVLTLIGGGVFGNPPSAIWEAIAFALDELDAVLDAPFDVVVAARTSLTTEQRALVRSRGGFVATFEAGRVTVDDAAPLSTA